MKNEFQNDFNWMLRESKGYFPWLGNNSYRVLKYLFFHIHHKFFPEFYERSSREVVRLITEEVVCENPLIDIFFKSLLRAEIRFISRYVPQRSNEERLTGNLVSEIDSSIFLVKEKFSTLSKEIYSEPKAIDFLYYDLSKGGKVEKLNGADLAFLLIIDLPDYPKIIKSIVLQAKKINGSVQIDKKQYETLRSHGENECSYLFYDMDMNSLTSPMILGFEDYDFKNKYKESSETKTKSFSINYQDILDGLPLSMFLVFRLIDDSVGRKHYSVREALEYFGMLSREKDFADGQPFNGRIGIASLGKNININYSNDNIFEIVV